MLRVQLLGGFQVERDGVPLTAFHSQKAQSLLAYLLIYRDRAHHRSVLANLFWGESDEARAQANLRHALYSLRHTIEGPEGRFGRYILAEGSAVRFNTASPYWLDTEQFEQTFECAQNAPTKERLGLLQQAVALYHGDLLPGFYDDWVVIEQEHLRELYLHALKELAAHYTEQQDYPHAIEWARRALTENPLQEDLHRALMQLYALIGDRTGALQQYSECEFVLHRELNAVPLPETHALYEKLVQGKSLERASPSDLPPETPFIGRERELEMLKELWHQVHQGHGQAVFIGGEVGVGKTSLVQRFIEQALTRSGDGVRSAEGAGGEGPVPLQGAAYALGSELPYQPLLQAVRQGLQGCSPAKLAELSALARRELAQFLSEVQEQFPELKPNPPLPPAQAKARWFAALTSFFELLARERPLVLFLDDLHWADEATLEYLGYLSEQLKNLRILLIGTYRAEEALEGSRLRTWLDKLGPGRSYHPLTLPRLSPAETDSLVQLLLGVGARRAVPLLYNETEGNPLFLTGLVRSLVQSGALLQDQEGRWRLVTEEISAAHWPENLRELIGASLRRAPGKARNLLGIAAVAGPNVDVAVLREILRQPEEELLDTLDELRRVCWVTEREGRYRFYHEIIRQAIYEDLSADRRKLWHRQIGQTLERLYPDRLDELSGELARHFERAAIPLKAIEYGKRAGQHAWRAYAYETALHFYDHTLKLAEKTEIPDRVETIVRLHCRRAEIFDRLGQREKQEIALQSATRWATQAGQPESLTVRNLWADFYIATGRYSQALAEAQAMMQDARFLGDQKIEARAYQQIGLAYLNQGEYGKAIENFEAAAPLCEEIGRLDHLGLTLTNMGVAHSALGDHGRTLDLYQRAHEIAVQTGDQLGQGRALTNLGIVYKKLRDFQKASECSEQAYRIWQEIGDRRAESHTLINLGNLFRTLGELDKAQEYLEQASTLSREIKNLQGLAIALHNLGSLHGEQRQQYTEALRYEDEAFAIAEQLGLKSLMAHILLNSAIFCAQLGRQPEAIKQLEQTLRLLQETQGTPDSHLIYWGCYELLSSLGQASSEQVRSTLQAAHESLLQQAQTITDSVQREDFLAAPENRKILQAWEAVQQRSP